MCLKSRKCKISALIDVLFEACADIENAVNGKMCCGRNGAGERVYRELSRERSVAVALFGYDYVVLSLIKAACGDGAKVSAEYAKRAAKVSK